jgi:hypothetical protein
MSTLHEAIDTLSLDALRKALADDPASANAPHEGLTPLAYLATKKPTIEDYQRLKALGLANRDTTEQVVRNRTLHIYETMAKFIATAPAVDLNAAGSDGRTALHRAAQEANEDLVNVLIDGGADLNSQDDQGRTPLMVAETFTIRRILAYAGADLKIQDAAGNTVLHLLLQKDPADPSSTAMISKADPSLLLVKNKEGMTPDELAEKKATHINERFAHYQAQELTRKKADWEEGFEEGTAGAIYDEMNAGCVAAPLVEQVPEVVSSWRRFWSWCCCIRRPRRDPQLQNKIQGAIPMVDPAHQAVRSHVMQISKDMLLKGAKFVEGPEEPIQKRERKPIVIEEFKQFTNEIAAAHVPTEMERTEFTVPLHRQSNFIESEPQPLSEIQEHLQRQRQELDEVFEILNQKYKKQDEVHLQQESPTEQLLQPQRPVEETPPEIHLTQAVPQSVDT